MKSGRGHLGASDTQEIFDGIKSLNTNIYTVNNNGQDSLRTKRDELMTCLINRVDLLKVKIQARSEVSAYGRDSTCRYSQYYGRM